MEITIAEIFPNFSCEDCCSNQTVDKLINKTAKNPAFPMDVKVGGMGRAEIDSALAALNSKKKELEVEDSKLRLLLYHQFLTKAKLEKMAELEKLTLQIDTLSQDLSTTSSLLFADYTSAAIDSSRGSKALTTSDSPRSSLARVPETPQLLSLASNANTLLPRKRIHLDISQYTGGSEAQEQPSVMDLIPLNLRLQYDVHQSRLQNHFADLQNNYFQLKTEGEDVFLDQDSARESKFSSILLGCTKYSRFRTIASLHYTDSYFNMSSSIVSSVEFDKDDELFATAGVTKKIKLFDFASVVADFHRVSSGFITKSSKDSGPLMEENYIEEYDEIDDRRKEHIPKYPVKEISCNTKIR
ncbi:coatomer subunit alpha [Kappamyces sp. JEL0680]|nr:coatomer subunit alpha [Kappamyces sp. JEL0680]